MGSKRGSEKMKKFWKKFEKKIEKKKFLRFFFWRFFGIFWPGTSRDRRVCPGIFALTLVLGQRDSGTGKTFLSRDKGTTGQGNFFVPGQRDNRTSRGTSRPSETLVWQGLFDKVFLTWSFWHGPLYMVELKLPGIHILKLHMPLQICCCLVQKSPLSVAESCPAILSWGTLITKLIRGYLRD